MNSEVILTLFAWTIFGLTCFVVWVGLVALIIIFWDDVFKDLFKFLAILAVSGAISWSIYYLFLRM